MPLPLRFTPRCGGYGPRQRARAQGQPRPPGPSVASPCVLFVLVGLSCSASSRLLNAIVLSLAFPVKSRMASGQDGVSAPELPAWSAASPPTCHRQSVSRRRCYAGLVRLSNFLPRNVPQWMPSLLKRPARWQAPDPVATVRSTGRTQPGSPAGPSRPSGTARRAAHPRCGGRTIASGRGSARR